MPPRKYTLGRRAESVRDTRERILSAAAEVYRELGISGTSMHRVARRADVAVGTVIYHFPDADRLADAAISHIIDQIEVPEAGQLTGHPGSPERLTSLAADLFTFYDRSAPWLVIYQRDSQHPAVASGFERFAARLQELLQSALGDLASDPAVFITTSALLDPAVHGALIDRGMSTPDSAALISDLIVTWIGHGRTRDSHRSAPPRGIGPRSPP